MLRVIREVQPRWVVGENVLGLVNWSNGLVFHEVQADLEAEGYEVQPFVLPAAAVNAPHRRDRVWFVAYCSSKRPNKWQQHNKQENAKEDSTRLDNRPERYGTMRTPPHPDSKMLESRNRKGKTGKRTYKKIGIESFDKSGNWSTFPTVSPVHVRNDGLSNRLDSITFSRWRQESIKSAGNAVVPQIVLMIFKSIQEYENKFG